jgi:hypothetical protein
MWGQRVKRATHGGVADGVKAHVQLGPRGAFDQVDKFWLRQAGGP